MSRTSKLDQVKNCSASYVLALNDTLAVVSGKWKTPIIGALFFGKKRFKELEREIPGITARMLSKELKELEAIGMVIRTVYDTMPVSVEYELTRSGKSFSRVMDVMVEWGIEHRECVMNKQKVFAKNHANS